MRRAAPARGATVARPALLKRAVLDNGLVVIAREHRAARSVAVRLVLPAGAAFDPPDRAGTAAMAANLLDRGAGPLTAEAIAEEFDHLGVSFLPRARGDTLEVDLRFLSHHLPLMLERLEVLVRDPVFPEEEVRRERERTLTAIAERDEDTAAVALETLCASLYPKGHPYHAPAVGTRESVARIERADLARFQSTRFVPGGAVLVLAGDLDPARAVELAADRFGGWRAPGRDGSSKPPMEIPDPPLPARQVTVVRPIEGKSQADIAMGFLPGLKRRSPDLQAALVLSNALGEFGLGGRLAKTIRDREGLAYYAHSFVHAGLGAGPFVARAGVAPEKVVKAAGLMREIIALVLKRGLTPSEISDAKRALASAVPRRLESNPGAAAMLAECEFYGLGVDFPERVPALIEAVDRAAVESAARTYLTLGRHALVVAGPAIAEKELL